MGSLMCSRCVVVALVIRRAATRILVISRESRRGVRPGGGLGCVQVTLVGRRRHTGPMFFLWRESSSVISELGKVRIPLEQETVGRRTRRQPKAAEILESWKGKGYFEKSIGLPVSSSFCLLGARGTRWRRAGIMGSVQWRRSVSAVTGGFPSIPPRALQGLPSTKCAQGFFHGASVQE